MSTRIHSWTRTLAQGVCLSVLVLAPSGGVVGQAASVLAAPDAVKAEDLHRKADALVATYQPRHWKQVARLLAEAAALRPIDDTLAVTEQVMAGQIFNFTGSLERAQASFESAAGQALANGRVADAAQAYLTAAIVAQARHRPEDATELGRKAERLARSPHLTQAEGDGIRDHIVWVNRLVAKR